MLTGLCAISLVAIEVSLTYMLKYHSSTYVRVSRQYDEALKVRPSRPGEPMSVLMVGNSLLLDGVDEQQLQQLTSGALRIYPIFFEDTGYYDWLYGLRRLFRHGARPQVVVVGLDANTSLIDRVREEYAPMVLFDVQDIFDIASDLGMSRTATSDLLLARYSAFWNTRSIFRRRILRRLIPHFEDAFGWREHTIPTGREFQAMVASRMRTLRELCEAHGARLIFVIPPKLSSESTVREMVGALQQARVEALVPIDPAALPARFYQRDAIHLNPEGAALFTAALATDLSSLIADGMTLRSPDHNPVYFRTKGVRRGANAPQSPDTRPNQTRVRAGAGSP